MPEAPATTPIAAPSKPASPAPTGAAEIKPTPPSELKPPPVKKASGEDPFAELDRLSKEDKPVARREAAKATPPPKPPTKDGKPAPAKDASAEDRPTDETKKEDGTASTAGSVETAKSTEPAKPVHAAELRAAYEALKKEHAELKRQTQEKASKPAETPPEVPKLVEHNKALTERIEKLTKELQLASYERSEEYQDRYVKPFQQAYIAGRNATARLKMTMSDGTQRQGTAADFDALMATPDDAQFAERATELFGPQAPLLVYHRARVQELDRQRSEAVDEAQRSARERDKQRVQEEAIREQQTKANMENLSKTFQKLNQDAVEKYPQWFAPEEGDEEGNAILAKSFELVDRVFQTGVPPDEMVRLHSVMRNKAAGFDRLVLKLKRATTQIAELQKELDQFKASEPGPDSGPRGKEAKPMSYEEEIDALAR